MMHISELRLVKGITQEVYEAVSPYLTALPGNTAVNVNTAPAPVLAAIAPSLSISSAEDLIIEREEKPFESIQAFLSHSLLQGSETNPQALSVQSSFFNLGSEVKIGNSLLKNNSLLHRINAQSVLVISRVPD